MRLNGQLHALATLTPEKFLPVPIGFKTGWPPELVWTLWSTENSCPVGIRMPGVQPMDRRYTELIQFLYSDGTLDIGTGKQTYLTHSRDVRHTFALMSNFAVQIRGKCNILSQNKTSNLDFKNPRSPDFLPLHRDVCFGIQRENRQMETLRN
jgi:hypothetical protein